ncbi:MAG: efflux RND transporter periplasmic adaptor subunit [Acidobacteria bacterium]|nr:efflux RND transporter periplasmic adaptor subunit [Acidobacteriota bacterium]
MAVERFHRGELLVRSSYLSLPALVFALLLAGCSSPKVQSAGGPPPVPVSVAVATQESVPVEIRAVGTVEASATVQVKSQVAGELVGVHFVEGGNVNKGDLLFEIDPRPYREALRQAEAAVVRDRAQLRQAEANLARDLGQWKNADADAARYEALAKEGVVSRTQYDQVRTNADALHESARADEAAIESARASVESDRVSVDRAKLELSYCEIRSPVSGRVGNLLVHAGNLVKANGDNALVVINQITPIFVTFGVPEQQLAAIRQSSSARKLPVQVSLQNDAGKLVSGVLTVIDNTVDPTTGTIRLKATFNNEERLLWPGQFVNVVLTLDTVNNATVVPSEAVQAGQQGQFVFVVKLDQSVESRNVTVGTTLGGKVIIEKGVAPGEAVVTDGQLRLFPGARIQAVPAGKVESQAL